MQKSLFSLLAAAVLTIGTAAAQTATTTPASTNSSGQMERRDRMQRSPAEMAQRQSERLTQQLGLSADQSAKVQQILLARGQEMQAMRGQARDAANPDQMREQMQANRAKYEAQFKEVLTADQYTKFTAMEAQMMQRGGRARGMESADADDAGKSKLKVKNGKVKAKKAAK
jgi:hypothetical protein